MHWSIPQCSQIFENLAHRIFSERRHPLLLHFLRHFNGQNSIIGETARWAQWLLRDSCYDARVFDAALKGVFSENRRLFGTSRDDPRGPIRSGAKVGVVATGISRDTSTFVIGNFNTAQELSSEQGKSNHHHRPPDPINYR